MIKPISEACLRNQKPIADALKSLLFKGGMTNSIKVLEIGSGTGQHAVFCAQQLPNVTWQPSDLLSNHEGMLQWIKEAQLNNVLLPLILDVDQNWPKVETDHVFTANTVHYISDTSVRNMFIKVSEVLPENGLFIIYGPVNENGQFTSEGNAGLDEWLKTCVNPLAGIKDLAEIEQVAKDCDLVLIDNLAMPANNRLLVLQKS
jgi:cyclopropane fatty-acyl-phospholipid synthase-like methyltransferase